MNKTSKLEHLLKINVFLCKCICMYYIDIHIYIYTMCLLTQSATQFLLKILCTLIQLKTNHMKENLNLRCLMFRKEWQID